MSQFDISTQTLSELSLDREQLQSDSGPLSYAYGGDRPSTGHTLALAIVAYVSYFFILTGAELAASKSIFIASFAL